MVAWKPMPTLFLVAALATAVAFVADRPLSPAIPQSPGFAEVRAMPVTTPPDQGRRLTLVDGRNGRRLAGAAVVLLPREMTPAMFAAREVLFAEHRGDVAMAALLLATRFGTKLVTDASGRTTLPTEFRGTAHLVSGDRHDQESIAESYEAEVAVFGRRQIAVQLTHADGRAAAGVDLELRSPFAVLHDPSGMQCRARTDVQGLARLELPTFTLRDAWTYGVTVHAMICGAGDAADIPIDPKAYRAGNREALRVALPPLGTLRVSACDGNGAPRRFGVEVTSTGDTHRDRVHTPPGIEHGELLVAPGRAYALRAHFAHAIGTRERIVTGPAAAGEVVTATFDARDEPLTVTVRLLTADGRPARGTVVCNEMLCMSRHWLCELAEDGRVAIALSPEQAALGRLTLGVQTPFGEGAEPRSLGAVEIRLPPTTEPPRRGVLDLGDATLQEEPVLVSGRVLDADGRPVAGAYVARRIANAPWPLPLAVRTDADGRFVLRMRNPFPTWIAAVSGRTQPDPGQVWLSISHPDKGSWPNVSALGPDVPGLEIGSDTEFVLVR